MAPRANKITTGYSFLRPRPLILDEGSPNHMGKRELVGEGETNVQYRMAKNFTCMWGLEGVPTFLD